MKLLLPAIILFCLSCKQPKPKLTMADLKFDNYEQEFIAKNKVDTVCYTRHFPKEMVFPVMLDTIRRNAYNEEGLLIYHEGNDYIFGSNVYIDYDEMGYLTKVTRRSCLVSHSYLKYKFIPDSLKLYEYVNQEKKAARWFLFDKKGRLIKSNYKQELDDFNISSITYDFIYDNSCRLKSIIGKNTEGSVVYRKSIYYQYNKPLMTILNYSQGVEKYSRKTYYNKLGLKYKTIEYDTITTYYKYITRK